MSVEDFYDRLEQLKSGDASERLVAAIWSDVTDRRGWRQEADQFDPDIRMEILETWLDLVRTAMPPTEPRKDRE